MEQLITAVCFCLTGCLIGWEANSFFRKFKQDRKGMQLAQLKEVSRAKGREDGLKGIPSNRLKDPIIVAAETIVSDHLRALKVFKGLKEGKK